MDIADEHCLRDIRCPVLQKLRLTARWRAKASLHDILASCAATIQSVKIENGTEVRCRLTIALTLCSYS